MKHDRQKCLEAGCDDFLAKPVDRTSLLAMVAKYAPKKASGAPAGHLHQSVADSREKG